jgi:tetratricopeptide (TPR) repeat protein
MRFSPLSAMTRKLLRNLLFLACLTLVAAFSPAHAQTSGERVSSSAATSPDSRPANASGVSPGSIAAPASPMEVGLDAFRSQDFSSAAAKFTLAAGDLGNKSAVAYAWLARAQLHLHKLEEADVAARKALEMDDNLPAAQSALAEVYFRQAKFAEADAISKKLVQANTSEARAYLTLARIYWTTANNRAAKSNIEAAHRLDPGDPDISAAWAQTLPPKERLEESRKRLAAGNFEDENDKQDLQAEIALLQHLTLQPSGGCKLATKALPMESRLESLAVDARTLRGFGLNVKVNDTSSKLLLDTGSTGILINSKIAERAGINRIADVPISGIGDRGPSSGYLAFAKRLQVGTLVFENCYISVVDKKNSLGEDGLIGADVFEDFLVDLDFPNVKLRLSELPHYPDEAAPDPTLHLNSYQEKPLHNRWIPPQFASYERVYRFGHFLLIPGEINSSPPKLFMLDTGAWDNFISPAAAKGYAKVHRDEETIVKGLSGRVNDVYFTGDVTLTFGHFQQKRYDLAALDLTDLSNDVGTEVSGTLGFNMLYLLEMKIDYRDQLVEFSYDPNRFH